MDNRVSRKCISGLGANADSSFQDWTFYQEASGIDTSEKSELGQIMKLKPSTKDVKDDFVFVPTDARLVNLPCSICQEKFEQGWNEETQQPTWQDAVRLGNRYYHASCYAEVARGAAAGSMATRQRTSNSSARGTPDPVLGKRRFENFRT
jgi:pre-mRNA cleavage complex 2 protein Pcf11